MRININYKILFILLIFTSCSKNDDEGFCMTTFDKVVESPYSDPIWHPTGKLIGFNHTPLKRIINIPENQCSNQIDYIFDEEATGFWIINSDGTNLRRILPTTLTTPAWSPDGKWIAFSQNAQIFIMPFDGTTFDTSALIQLTTEGRNFFPSWSPDGEWITYDSSKESPTGLKFIWKMKKNGNENTRIVFTPNQGEARMPFWGNNLNITYQQYTDTSAEIFTIDSQGNSMVQLTNNQDRDFLPKYAPNKDLIGFISQSQEFGSVELWTVDISSNEKLKLTTEGCQGLSWSPDGKIVYVNYDYSGLDEEKGTLWIMNNDGTGKFQLTFNDFELVH